MKHKLAIFDLDGTLFDTKNVNYMSYKYALNKCGFNSDMNYEFFRDFCNGNNYKVFLPKIAAGISEAEMEKVHIVKKEAYADYLDRAVRNDYLFDLIESLHDDYIIALVTTASRKNTTDILDKFGVLTVFDIIITQEDVKNTKPNPECFMLAIEKANVSTSDTIIFEDSDVGIEAARLSGAGYVKVCGYN